MSNQLSKTIALVLACLLISCSDDESTRDLGENGFNFNSEYYVLNNAFIKDENIIDETPDTISLVLSNVNLISQNAISNVTRVQFDFNNIVTLQPETYTDITNYSIQKNAYFNEDNFMPGVFLLDATQSGLTASGISVVINSITEARINLTFSVTRTDGQVFTGHYNGIYNDISVTEE